MNLIKCENGHFFDTERYSTCPHCEAPRGDNVTVPVMRSPVNEDVTVAMSHSAPVTEAISHASAPAPAPDIPVPVKTGSLQDAVNAASSGAVNAPVENSEKTVGFFSSAIGSEPVVGWLVCTEGEHFGEDFRLKSGRNFIGRAPGMDVSITKDGTVSRERHTAIVYEPKANIFIVQPGDSKELSYLNGNVVLSPLEIRVNDRLTVGQTELMFIPCCSGEFKWDIEKKEKKD